MLVAFAANPRPSLAERRALASANGISEQTASNWFHAERSRQPASVATYDAAVAAAAAAAPPPEPAADKPLASPPPTMRKRKAAGATSYEPPVDAAGVEALSSALAAEAAELRSELEGAREALPLPALPAAPSALSTQVLYRAVRGASRRPVPLGRERGSLWTLC